MKLVTFEAPQKRARAGFLLRDQVVDMEAISEGLLPSLMADFLQEFDRFFPLALQYEAYLLNHDYSHNWELMRQKQQTYPLSDVILLAPLPRPSSLRDFYAFEQHVSTCRSHRGLQMIEEWYQIPVFYYSNHQAIIGPDRVLERPSATSELDFELEIACIISKQGRNISADKAEDYIAGYCIMNDWSARDLQRQEVKVGLGPAKGKDFATSLGPYLVTKDELEPYRIKDRYNLAMKARVNGKLISQGNFQDIHYSFGQMIERASQDTTLYPGDVIGSGTVGTGCILELGVHVQPWLESGDIVELEITGLGVLRNTIK